MFTWCTTVSVAAEELSIRSRGIDRIAAVAVRSFARAARFDFDKSTRSDGASRKDPHMTICASCGRGAHDHDRHVRFRLPDPVLETDEQDRVDGAWQSGPDSMTSVMMEIPAHGAFVRAQLPVRLTGGFTVTYGLWVGIRPEDLQHAFEVWWEPEYADLRLTGLLANEVRPWGLLGAHVDLAVLNVDATPYCVSSDDPQLRQVLSQQWPHDHVLATLPSDG
jgi:hypothetical protein